MGGRLAASPPPSAPLPTPPSTPPSAGDEYGSLLWELFGCITVGVTADVAVWKSLDEISFLGTWNGGSRGAPNPSPLGPPCILRGGRTSLSRVPCLMRGRDAQATAASAAAAAAPCRR